LRLLVVPDVHRSLTSPRFTLDAQDLADAIAATMKSSYRPQRQLIILVLSVILVSELSNAFLPAPRRAIVPLQWTEKSSAMTATSLWGKKDKRKGGGGGKGQQPQEKQSVKEARFDAQTRQYMFTMVGLSKLLPDKSKTILKNIHLSFYPGAKIGMVGLNGSGKSTLLKIMAGVDKEFDGTARPLPGASIGYLSQEPELPFDTVQECIDEAVKPSQAILDEFSELSMKLADPDLTDEETEKIMTQTDALNNQIEAGNLWDLDRVVSRAMDALRVSNDKSLRFNSIRSLVRLCLQAGFRVKSIYSMCGTFERASVLNQSCFPLFSHVRSHLGMPRQPLYQVAKKGVSHFVVCFWEIMTCFCSTNPPIT
jgi:energy-coupling factor transporter ATP-binding protein EcfA2